MKKFILFILIGVVGGWLLRDKISNMKPMETLKTLPQSFSLPKLETTKKNEKTKTKSPAPSQKIKLLRDKAAATFPTQSDFARLPESETHYTPRILLEASDVLAEVHEGLENQTISIREGLGFFHDCARNSHWVVSLRATCLKGLQEWADKAQLSNLIHLEDYPEDVRTISSRLPTVR